MCRDFWGRREKSSSRRILAGFGFRCVSTCCTAVLRPGRARAGLWRNTAGSELASFGCPEESQAKELTKAELNQTGGLSLRSSSEGQSTRISSLRQRHVRGRGRPPLCGEGPLEATGLLLLRFQAEKELVISTVSCTNPKEGLIKVEVVSVATRKLCWRPFANRA